MSAPVSGPIELAGQTAVITGASGGIGRATCEAFAREGANIVGCDVDQSSLDALEEHLTAQGTPCVTVVCDVTEPDDIDQLRTTALDTFGRVEILAVVHGIVSRASLADESLTEWNRTMVVNLTAPYLLCQAFFDHMVEHEYGKIVTIGSIAGRTGRVRPSGSYSASKGGLHAFTRWLALQGAPYSVYANAIAPGPVKTPLTDMGASFSAEAQPLGRAGEPKDIAESVVFLASQQSNWITGTVLDVNGGLLTD